MNNFALFIKLIELWELYFIASITTKSLDFLIELIFNFSYQKKKTLNLTSAPLLFLMRYTKV